MKKNKKHVNLNESKKIMLRSQLLTKIEYQYKNESIWIKKHQFKKINVVSTTMDNSSKTLRHFCEIIAGAISSCCATLILQPFDVIRLTQMVNETTLMFTIREIYNSRTKKSLLNFYRALPISLMAYTLTYMIYFPINSYLKRENLLELDSKWMIYIVANIPPAIISMTIVNPLWVIKSRQVTNNFQHIGIVNTAKSIYRTSGYSGFTKGLAFGYLTNIDGIISFTLYDVFKDLIVATTAGYQSVQDCTTLDLITCSLASKTIATIVAYPILVLHIRQQTWDNQSHCKLLSSVFTENPKTLYYGLTPALAQQLPKNTITMVIYENIMKIFGF